MTDTAFLTPSRSLAAEIRAECARQGVSLRALAQAVESSHTWVTRRVSPSSDVDITMEDFWLMADALGASRERLLRDAGLLGDYAPPGVSTTSRYVFPLSLVSVA